MKVRRFLSWALVLVAFLPAGGCGGSAPAADTKPPPRAPVVMFLGDSYTVGPANVAPETTYAAEAARRLGWQVILAGYRGTGFVAPGRVGKTFSVLFDEQLGWRPAPDMIVLSGGHNDWPYPPSLVALAAKRLVTKAKQRWPGVRMVLMGPMWGGDPAPEALDIRDALAGVSRELNTPFVDPLQEEWITGDHRAGVGNAQRYILPDGTHPNLEGSRYLADRFVTDMRRLGLTRP